MFQYLQNRHSQPKLLRLSISGFLLLFLSGCQQLGQPSTHHSLLEQRQEQQHQLTRQQLGSQLNAFQGSQVAGLTELQQQLQAVQIQLDNLREENQRFQRQHTFQIEELGRELPGRGRPEPGFSNSRVTEVVQDDGKLLLGRYEWVALPAQQLVLPARVDSGANTSSLHAVNLREFERDGRSWVRFETHYQPENSNREPQKAEIEAPLVRNVRILQASGSESRPVISLPMQLGPLVQEVEFTLSDRGDMTYPVLLGRRFMMDIAVIDVARTYVQGKPELQQPGEAETSASGEVETP
ncbi:ATP-dependent zinc protease family protein [Marinospirillum alkaliphilum]|uniref:Uncharacterized conserved protein n=1 Tax=Marinospirillum alkaliphilum DSM 21637 TaxID=1122209 RepID=A0A1K1XMS1_9GAMM|nr:ATP-dependent zinc protease [Marinospirillum alkaliphilum]SFX50903.1 Uncharacterized conserved protein [Marinospirillum alkaliphilum DSM 21637]